MGAEKLRVDCYVSSRKWEQEVWEKARMEEEGVISITKPLKGLQKYRKYDGRDVVKHLREVREAADVVGRTAAKEIYRERTRIIEPVFRELKFNLGFVRFRKRG